LDREDVNNCLVDFRDLHEDVLLHKFNVQSLLACFSLVNDSEIPAGGEPKKLDATNLNENNPKNGGGKRKSGSKGCKNESGKKQFGAVENKDQVSEFKMTKNETWEKFQGKCVEYRAKFKDTYMCPRFYTKGIRHVKCKFAASHIPAKDVPEEVKKAYCNYLTKIRQLE
jgi:hypothetical protein